MRNRRCKCARKNEKVTSSLTKLYRILRFAFCSKKAYHRTKADLEKIIHRPTASIWSVRFNLNSIHSTFNRFRMITFLLIFSVRLHAWEHETKHILLFLNVFLAITLITHYLDLHTSRPNKTKTFEISLVVEILFKTLVHSTSITALLK